MKNHEVPELQIKLYKVRRLRHGGQQILGAVLFAVLLLAQVELDGFQLLGARDRFGEHLDALIIDVHFFPIYHYLMRVLETQCQLLERLNPLNHRE